MEKCNKQVKDRHSPPVKQRANKNNRRETKKKENLHFPNLCLMQMFQCEPSYCAFSTCVCFVIHYFSIKQCVIGKKKKTTIT